MKLSVIVPDQTVIIDGEVIKLDLSAFALPPGMHAVQFEDAAGEIEWASQLGRPKAANMPLTQVQCAAMFTPLIEAAQMAIAKRRAAAEEAARAAEAAARAAREATP